MAETPASERDAKAPVGFGPLTPGTQHPCEGRSGGGAKRPTSALSTKSGLLSWSELSNLSRSRGRGRHLSGLGL